MKEKVTRRSGYRNYLVKVLYQASYHLSILNNQAQVTEAFNSTATTIRWLSVYMAQYQFKISQHQNIRIKRKLKGVWRASCFAWSVTVHVLADVSCTLDFSLAGFLATVGCSGHCSQCIFAVEALVSWRSAGCSALRQTEVGCPGWGADLRIAERAQIVCNTLIGWDSIFSFRENVLFSCHMYWSQGLGPFGYRSWSPKGMELTTSRNS